MASNELTPNSEDRIMCVKVGKVKKGVAEGLQNH